MSQADECSLENSERRRFLNATALTAGAVAAGTALGLAPGEAEGGELDRGEIRRRKRDALEVRRRTASQQFRIVDPGHPNNGDEDRYEDFRGSYSKGLAHDAAAFVDVESFAALQSAAAVGTQAAFNHPLLKHGTRGQANPLNAYCFQLIGADSHNQGMAPAPAFASRNTAIDMVERYWMALCRDVPFIEYDSNPTVAAACADLNALGFEDEFGFECTPQTLFRAAYPAAQVGPHVSQFLLNDFVFGNQRIVQASRYPQPGLDYMTTWSSFAAINDGTVDPSGTDVLLGERRISTLRDSCQWVHVDYPFQAPLWAAVQLAGYYGASVSAFSPYANGSIRTADPFGSLGAPDFAGHAVLAGLYALKHAWFQKWCVHRRLRPEVYAARVHLYLTENIDLDLWAPIKNSTVLDRIAAHNQAQGGEATYLLPMGFPEGSPTHPAYPGGHSTFVAAGATWLKAIYEDAPIENPVIADAAGNLLPYTGADADQMTLHGELDKLIGNITLFRDAAGLHWRTDGVLTGGPSNPVGVETGGNLLGERLAIGMLRDLRQTYREVLGEFTFTSLTGETLIV